MILSQTKWWAPVAVVLSLVLAAVGLAQQANQVTISVSPTVFELSANPGDSIKNSFRIVNGTDRDLALTAGPKNFTAEGEEGAVNLTEEETGFSLASWITVDPAAVTIPARGSQTFSFEIAVPSSAEPGGHFGSVIVKTEPVAIDTTGAAVSQEAGPLILVSVAGDIVKSAKIIDFAAAKGFWESGPVVLNTRVENQGNVHFKPSGNISIKNMFGNEVTKINLEEKNVLPGTIRKLVNEWNPGFGLGRYTADLSIVFGTDNTLETASASFIIFPYKVIIPAIISVILLVFALIKFRRRLAAAGRALAGK
ncbi:MAG TPA: hypothetical protein VGA08_01820 [Candidatus Saccharimonadales bacterium]